MDKLFALSQLRKPGVTPDFRAEARGTELTLTIYGLIGPISDDGILAADVAAALRTPHTSVVCRINSPGGSAFEGIAIYNLLKSSGKNVRVIVDGLAASAASVIAMAGNTIEMGTGTMMMIHPAQTIGFGSAADMRETADVLEKATENLAQIYVARTGLRIEEVLAMMGSRETWLTPDEAIKKGFADAMHEGESQVQALAESYNLAALYEDTPEYLKVFKADASEPNGTPLADAANRLLQLY